MRAPASCQQAGKATRLVSIGRRPPSSRNVRTDAAVSPKERDERSESAKVKRERNLPPPPPLRRGEGGQASSPRSARASLSRSDRSAEQLHQEGARSRSQHHRAERETAARVNGERIRRSPHNRERMTTAGQDVQEAKGKHTRHLLVRQELDRKTKLEQQDREELHRTVPPQRENRHHSTGDCFPGRQQALLDCV